MSTQEVAVFMLPLAFANPLIKDIFKNKNRNSLRLFIEILYLLNPSVCFNSGFLLIEF